MATKEITYFIILYPAIHFQFLSNFPHSVFGFKMKTNKEIKFVFKTC